MFCSFFSFFLLFFFFPFIILLHRTADPPKVQQNLWAVFCSLEGGCLTQEEEDSKKHRRREARMACWDWLDWVLGVPKRLPQVLKVTLSDMLYRMGDFAVDCPARWRWAYLGLWQSSSQLQMISPTLARWRWAYLGSAMLKPAKSLIGEAKHAWLYYSDSAQVLKREPYLTLGTQQRVPMGQLISAPACGLKECR